MSGPTPIRNARDQPARQHLVSARVTATNYGRGKREIVRSVG